MKIAAFILFALFVLALISAVQRVSSLGETGANASYNVGYAVGAFMVPMVLLIGALICWNKSKKY